jgi:hypothetical protein
MAQRSTTLSLVARHCPRALDYYEAQVPVNRDHFAVGIAAHAILQAVTGSGEINAACLLLATLGRSFDGVPEPPLSAEAVRDGRELAERWLHVHPVAGSAEVGIGVDRDWRLVGYGGADAYYRGVLDYLTVEVHGDEEESYTVAVARDYKSAWTASVEDLDSIQMRGQACLLAARYDGWKDSDGNTPSAVRIEIGALRTQRIYGRTIFLDADGLELLAQWRRDIDLAIEAAEAKDATGNRPARPGAGCTGCPYVARCEPARAYLRGSVGDGTPQAIATRYAVASAMTAELGAQCKVLAEEAPLQIDGGVVGYVERTERQAADDAHRDLCHAWYGVGPDWDTDNGATLGLVKALSPGVGSISNAAKVLHPFTRNDPTWKDKRDGLVSLCTTQHIVSRFGVHK